MYSLPWWISLAPADACVSTTGSVRKIAANGDVQQAVRNHLVNRIGVGAVIGLKQVLQANPRLIVEHRDDANIMPPLARGDLEAAEFCSNSGTDM